MRENKAKFSSKETTRRLNLNPDLLIEVLTARTTSLHLTQHQVKQSYPLASSVFRHIKVCTQIINEIQFLTTFYKLASILPRPQNIPPWPLSHAWVTSSELRDWPGHQARQRSADPVLWGVQSLDLERFHVEPSHWAACGADLNLFQKDNRRLFRSTGWVPQFGAKCPGLIPGGTNAQVFKYLRRMSCLWFTFTYLILVHITF